MRDEGRKGESERSARHAQIRRTGNGLGSVVTTVCCSAAVPDGGSGPFPLDANLTSCGLQRAAKRVWLPMCPVVFIFVLSLHNINNENR